MPGEVPGGRTDRIAREATFRILTSSIRVSVDCPWVENSLRYLVQHARHDLPVDHHLTYVVREEAGVYSIRAGEALIAEGLPREAVLEPLFNHLQERALEAMPGWVRMHAGCGEIGGRRFLVAGDKYAGKSTLMASLLFSGLSVFCDELTLLRNGVAVPVPRKFYIREGSLPLLPRLERLAPRLPFMQNARDGRVVAFDPQEAGSDWWISAAPVDAVFSLVPNHGRSSRLEPCPKYVMAERVMKQCNPPAQRDRNWVGDICAMLDRAATYELHLGDLDQARSALLGVLGT